MQKIVKAKSRNNQQKFNFYDLNITDYSEYMSKFSDSIPEHHLDEDTEIELSPPSMYQVILNNDDYTPMDFVIEVLMKFFRLDQEAATDVMLKVHYHGKAVCGVYSAEIAETKVVQVNQYAREHQHPLLCTMEQA